MANTNKTSNGDLTITPQSGQQPSRLPVTIVTRAEDELFGKAPAGNDSVTAGNVQTLLGASGNGLPKNETTNEQAKHILKNGIYPNIEMNSDNNSNIQNPEAKTLTADERLTLLKQLTIKTNANIKARLEARAYVEHVLDSLKEIETEFKTNFNIICDTEKEPFTLILSSMKKETSTPYNPSAMPVIVGMSVTPKVTDRTDVNDVAKPCIFLLHEDKQKKNIKWQTAQFLAGVRKRAQLQNKLG